MSPEESLKIYITALTGEQRDKFNVLWEECDNLVLNDENSLKVTWLSFKEDVDLISNKNNPSTEEFQTLYNKYLDNPTITDSKQSNAGQFILLKNQITKLKSDMKTFDDELKKHYDWYDEHSKGWGNFWYPVYAFQKLFTWQSFARTAYRTDQFRKATTELMTKDKGRLTRIIDRLEKMISTYNDAYQYITGNNRLQSNEETPSDYLWKQHTIIKENISSWVNSLK